MSGVLLWAAVGAVGAAGALARFLVDRAITAATDTLFPVGILAVNLTGAFVLGVVSGAEIGHDALLLAGAGALGAYTTFSTWMVDTEELREGRKLGLAALNIAIPLALGLAAVAVGRALGESL